MANGYIVCSGTSPTANTYDKRLNWSTVYDPNTNKSILTVALDVYSYTYNRYEVWGEKDIYINGEKFHYMTYTALPVNQWVRVVVCQKEIQHDNLGNASATIYTTSWLQDEANGPGYVSCPNTQINWSENRKSQVTLSKTLFNIGETIRVYTNRKSTNFGHEIWIQYGSYNKRIDTTGISDYFDWNTGASGPVNLFSQIPNSISGIGRIYIKTFYGATFIGESEVYFTCNVVNSNPIFSNFTYEDVNPITIALTGNNQIVVKGYSNVKGIISTVNKATAQNSASMSKYRFVIGDLQKDIGYSTTSEVSATLDKINNNVFGMYAIDSRNFSTLKTISPLQYKIYTDLIIKSVIVSRGTGGVGKAVTLSIDGSIWNGNFGAIENSIISCKYQYKKTTEINYTDGATILNSVKNGEVFSFNGLIRGDLGAEGFDVKFTYDIKIIVKDRLSSYEFNVTLGKGTPNIAISPKGVAINCMYDETIYAELQVDGKISATGLSDNLAKALFLQMYQVGDILLTDTNSNPGNRFGGGAGTWVVWAPRKNNCRKKFKWNFCKCRSRSRSRNTNIDYSTYTTT